MSPQLEIFVDAGRIESLEQTIVDLGVDTARALEAQIAVTDAIRARLSVMERLVDQLCRNDSAMADRLRILEIRAGIRPKEDKPISVHALSREVAA